MSIGCQTTKLTKSIIISLLYSFKLRQFNLLAGYSHHFPYKMRKINLNEKLSQSAT